MGYKDFPYHPDQQGWGILVTNPGTMSRALVGIFKDEQLAHDEAAARRKHKTVKNPRVVKWTEAEYNKVNWVYDIHFLFCKDRQPVATAEYRDPQAKSIDTKPEPDKSKKQYTGVKFYTDVRSMIIQGRNQAYLRTELQDHPANQLEIPPTVPIYTAKNNWAENDYERYVAFMRVNDKDTVIDCAENRNKLFDDLLFAVVYSQYKPSIYYRAFRTAYGFDSDSNDYGTQELRKQAAPRMMAAAAVMAGASNETALKILKQEG